MSAGLYLWLLLGFAVDLDMRVCANLDGSTGLNALEFLRILKVYYNIDGGLTKFVEVAIPDGTTIYHYDQDCTKHAILDAVYRVISDSGKMSVGRVTIIHASF